MDKRNKQRRRLALNPAFDSQEYGLIQNQIVGWSAYENIETNLTGAAACGVKVTPSPFSGPPGTVVTITGTGWPYPGDAIDACIWLCGETILVDNNGSFSANFTVPATATPGQQTFALDSTISPAHYAVNFYDFTVTSGSATADLSIRKTASASSVKWGDSLTYQVTVTNNGPGTATNVTIADTLSDKVFYSSLIFGQGNCPVTPSGSTPGGAIQCTVASLPSGSSATVTIYVSAANGSGTIINSATVSANESDPNTANNTATVSTTLISYSISGKVTNSAGTGISGVTVSAAGTINTSTTSGSNGSYTLTNLPVGTYTLTASKNGYTFSPSSNQATVPPNQTSVNFIGTTSSAGQPPAAPSNPQATTIDAAQIRVTWQDNSNNETGFKIDDGTGVVATVGANVTSATIGGLAPNSYHCYAVYAYNNSGSSASTNWACTTTTPDANFTASPRNGSAPLTVHFTNTSQGNPVSWAWDFDNNGTIDSTEQNPTYTYNAAGNYTVKLTVTGLGGTNVKTLNNYITVSSPSPGNFAGTVLPIYPPDYITPSVVMQGGELYRYYRLLDANGAPIPNAKINLSKGSSTTSDTQGYFTITIAADTLGGIGRYYVSVQSITIGNQAYPTNGQPTFPVEVKERRYSHAWSYGASTRAKGGVSAGLIAYLQRTTSGGLELQLAETNPAVMSDDNVLMKEDYSDESGAGGGIGLEKELKVAILKIRAGASATSEFNIRTMGHTTARFRNPYTSDDKKGQAIFLLASAIDSIQNAFPGKPFGVAFLRSALDSNVPYHNYITEQQAGFGTKITPLKLNVGTEASLGLLRSGVLWKQRALGFDVVDLNVSTVTLETLTDYRDRNELGLASEMGIDLDFSALSLQIGDFKNKFAGLIGQRAKKVRLEIILDSNTQQLKRLELSLTGEGNPDAFTDVLKEEVTVKAIIAANELTPQVLSRLFNVLRLLQVAQNTGTNPLQIGSSAMVKELNNLLAPLSRVDYEVTVDDGAETRFETELGITALIKIELGPGISVKKTRNLVRERGVFLSGHPYKTESYSADSYVSRPGKTWGDLSLNALGGLWESVKDQFGWISKQVTDRAGWVINIISRKAGGSIMGGVRITTPPSTGNSSATVSATSWVPASSNAVSNLMPSPSVTAASGTNFVVGGIYDLQPYTMTINPAATLVITYTDNAASGIDESGIKMFHWNPNGNNWQPVISQANLANNTFTANITELGTYTLGYDVTPPQISILSPERNSVSSNTIPVISALVTDSGVGTDPASIQMRLDGQVVATKYIVGSGELVYIPSADLGTGLHKVAISARDTLGNSSTATWGFTVGSDHHIYLPLLKNK